MLVVLLADGRRRDGWRGCRTGRAARVADEALATASGCTPWIRSSVERSTREIIDVTMIVTMNHEAILMPSGRSIDVDERRVDEDQRDQAERRRTGRARRRVQRHGDRGRRHQHQHAGRVGAALRLDVGLEENRDQER